MKAKRNWTKGLLRRVTSFVLVLVMLLTSVTLPKINWQKSNATQIGGTVMPAEPVFSWEPSSADPDLSYVHSGNIELRGSDDGALIIKNTSGTGVTMDTAYGTVLQEGTYADVSSSYFDLAASWGLNEEENSKGYIAWFHTGPDGIGSYNNGIATTGTGVGGTTVDYSGIADYDEGLISFSGLINEGNELNWIPPQYSDTNGTRYAYFLVKYKADGYTPRMRIWAYGDQRDNNGNTYQQNRVSDEGLTAYRRNKNENEDDVVFIERDFHEGDGNIQYQIIWVDVVRAAGVAGRELDNFALEVNGADATDFGWNGHPSTASKRQTELINKDFYLYGIYGFNSENDAISFMYSDILGEDGIVEDNVRATNIINAPQKVAKGDLVASHINEALPGVWAERTPYNYGTTSVTEYWAKSELYQSVPYVLEKGGDGIWNHDVPHFAMGDAGYLETTRFTANTLGSQSFRLKLMNISDGGTAELYPGHTQTGFFELNAPFEVVEYANSPSLPDVHTRYANGHAYYEYDMDFAFMLAQDDGNGQLIDDWSIDNYIVYKHGVNSIGKQVAEDAIDALEVVQPYFHTSRNSMTFDLGPVIYDDYETVTFYYNNTTGTEATFELYITTYYDDTNLDTVGAEKKYTKSVSEGEGKVTFTIPKTTLGYTKSEVVQDFAIRVVTNDKTADAAGDKETYVDITKIEFAARHELNVDFNNETDREDHNAWDFNNKAFGVSINGDAVQGVANENNGYRFELYNIACEAYCDYLVNGDTITDENKIEKEEIKVYAVQQSDYNFAYNVSGYTTNNGVNIMDGTFAQGQPNAAGLGHVNYSFTMQKDTVIDIDVVWVDYTNNVTAGIGEINSDGTVQTYIPAPTSSTESVVLQGSDNNAASGTSSEVLTEATYTKDASKAAYYADGTIHVEFDPTLGYIVTDIVPYFADANGNLLEGYASLQNQPVRLGASSLTFNLVKNTIIPEGAAKIVVYARTAQGLSNGIAVDLASGFKTEAEAFSDDDLTAEFQVLSDIHIVNPDYRSEIEATDIDDYWHHTYPNYPENVNPFTIHNQRFEMALRDIAAMQSSKSIGIVVNGDVTEHNQAYEYTECVEIYNTVNASVGGTLKNMLWTIGNHDFGLYANRGNGLTTNHKNLSGSAIGDFYVNLFLNQIAAGGSAVYNPGVSGIPYYSISANGCKFIYLGSEEYDETGAVDAILSQTQLDWLAREIGSTDKNMPVFVFCHQSMYNTVAGSLPGQGWDGITNNAGFDAGTEDRLAAILASHPNAIYFAGHSHWDLNSEGNMYTQTDNMCDSFNTASTAYLWSTYAGDTGHYVDGSQGYYVYVYSDGTVLVKGRDFTTNEWLPSAMYCVEHKDGSSLSADSYAGYVDGTTKLYTNKTTFSYGEPIEVMYNNQVASTLSNKWIAIYASSATIGTNACKQYAYINSGTGYITFNNLQGVTTDSEAAASLGTVEYNDPNSFTPLVPGTYRIVTLGTDANGYAYATDSAELWITVTDDTTADYANRLSVGASSYNVNENITFNFSQVYHGTKAGDNAVCLCIYTVGEDPTVDNSYMYAYPYIWAGGGAPFNGSITVPCSGSGTGTTNLNFNDGNSKPGVGSYYAVLINPRGRTSDDKPYGNYEEVSNRVYFEVTNNNTYYNTLYQVGGATEFTSGEAIELGYASYGTQAAWLAIYGENDDPNTVTASKQYVYVTGIYNTMASGTATFNALPAGKYYAQILVGETKGSYAALSEKFAFSVLDREISISGVDEGAELEYSEEQLDISYTGADSGDWIGIFRDGVTDKSLANAVQYAFIAGDGTVEFCHPTNGTTANLDASAVNGVHFSTDAVGTVLRFLPAGNYYVQAFDSDNGNIALCDPINFSVKFALDNITEGQTFEYSEMIPVYYYGAEYGDWLGVFANGVTTKSKDASLQYACVIGKNYVNFCPDKDGTSGDLTPEAGTGPYYLHFDDGLRYLPAGTYYVQAFDSNGNALCDAINFTVNAAPTEEPTAVPTVAPTAEPTEVPVTAVPTATPTVAPTAEPTATPVIFKENNSGVTVKAPTGTDIDSSMILNVEVTNDVTIPADSEFASYTAVVYDIYFTKDDNRVSVEIENGTVTVTIPVPTGMNGKKCKVVHISNDGMTVTDMNASYDGMGNMTFTTKHFSYYAVIEAAASLNEAAYWNQNGHYYVTADSVTVYTDALDGTILQKYVTAEDGTESLVNMTIAKNEMFSVTETRKIEEGDYIGIYGKVTVFDGKSTTTGWIKLAKTDVTPVEYETDTDWGMGFTNDVYYQPFENLPVGKYFDLTGTIIPNFKEDTGAFTPNGANSNDYIMLDHKGAFGSFYGQDNVNVNSGYQSNDHELAYKRVGNTVISTFYTDRSNPYYGVAGFSFQFRYDWASSYGMAIRPITDKNQDVKGTWDPDGYYPDLLTIEHDPGDTTSGKAYLFVNDESGTGKIASGRPMLRTIEFEKGRDYTITVIMTAGSSDYTVVVDGKVIGTYTYSANLNNAGTITTVTPHEYLRGFSMFMHGFWEDATRGSDKMYFDNFVVGEIENIEKDVLVNTQGHQTEFIVDDLIQITYDGTEIGNWIAVYRYDATTGKFYSPDGTTEIIPNFDNCAQRAYTEDGKNFAYFNRHWDELGGGSTFDCGWHPGNQSTRDSVWYNGYGCISLLPKDIYGDACDYAILVFNAGGSIISEELVFCTVSGSCPHIDIPENVYVKGEQIPVSYAWADANSKIILKDENGNVIMDPVISFDVRSKVGTVILDTENLIPGMTYRLVGVCEDANENLVETGYKEFEIRNPILAISGIEGNTVSEDEIFNLEYYRQYGEAGDVYASDTYYLAIFNKNATSKKLANALQYALIENIALDQINVEYAIEYNKYATTLEGKFAITGVIGEVIYNETDGLRLPVGDYFAIITDKDGSTLSKEMFFSVTTNNSANIADSDNEYAYGEKVNVSYTGGDVGTYLAIFNADFTGDFTKENAIQFAPLFGNSTVGFNTDMITTHPDIRDMVGFTEIPAEYLPYGDYVVKMIDGETGEALTDKGGNVITVAFSVVAEEVSIESDEGIWNAIPGKVTITIDNDDSTSGVTPYGSIKTFVAEANIGYSFVGWYELNNDGSVKCLVSKDAKYTVENIYVANTKIFAIFVKNADKANLYYVDFVNDANQVVQSIPAIEGGSVNMAELSYNRPIKVGYTFNGWTVENYDAKNVTKYFYYVTNESGEYVLDENGERTIVVLDSEEAAIAQAMTFIDEAKAEAEASGEAVAPEKVYALIELAGKSYDVLYAYTYYADAEEPYGEWTIHSLINVSANITVKASWKAASGTGATTPAVVDVIAYNDSGEQVTGSFERPINASVYVTTPAALDGKTFVGWVDMSKPARQSYVVNNDAVELTEGETSADEAVKIYSNGTVKVGNYYYPILSYNAKYSFRVVGHMELRAVYTSGTFDVTTTKPAVTISEYAQYSLRANEKVNIAFNAIVTLPADGSKYEFVDFGYLLYVSGSDDVKPITNFYDIDGNMTAADFLSLNTESGNGGTFKKLSINTNNNAGQFFGNVTTKMIDGKTLYVKPYVIYVNSDTTAENSNWTISYGNAIMIDASVITADCDAINVTAGGKIKHYEETQLTAGDCVNYAAQ